MSARKELPSESLLIFRILVIHISRLISLFSAMNCVSQQKIPFVSLHRGIGASMSTRFTTKRGMSARKQQRRFATRYASFNSVKLLTALLKPNYLHIGIRSGRMTIMAAGLTNTTMTMMILIHVEVNSSLGQLASWHAKKEIVSFHCKLLSNYYTLGH